MSTVIKKGETGRPLQRLCSFDLADHLAEARQAVTAARREAQRIVAEAKAESARLRGEARQIGHREGREQGHAEGLEVGQAQGLAEAAERFNREQGDLAASMTSIIESIEGCKRDLLIEANRDLLEFAVAVASKVTRCVGEVDRQAALANVEEALRLVGEKTDVTVRVNPVDAETLRRFAADRARQLGRQQHVSVVEDESLAPGGAVVTTGGMEVDASIETQLAQITTLLLGQKTELRTEEKQRLMASGLEPMANS
jgi:flagellar assembly protein FliH